MSLDSTIRVFWSGESWHALYTGPLGVQVKAEYGSNILPTMYGASVPGPVVVELLRGYHHDVSIMLTPTKGAT